MIPGGLRLPSFAADHLLDVDHHPEATVDRREQISTHTDHDLCRGRGHLDNTGAPTGAAQDLTHLDRDHRQEDEEAEDGIALGGMAQDGEVRATAVIAAMTIEAEAEVAEEEAEDGVDTAI